MTTPSESLANLIAPRLVKEKLFLEEDALKYKAKIASGAMKPEDWLLAIEKAMNKDGAK
jgi:hypothetical protein